MKSLSKFNGMDSSDGVSVLPGEGEEEGGDPAKSWGV